jgi:hypothetical protein
VQSKLVDALDLLEVGVLPVGVSGTALHTGLYTILHTTLSSPFH